MCTRRSQRSIACLHRRSGNEPHPCGTACAGLDARHAAKHALAAQASEVQFQVAAWRGELRRRVPFSALRVRLQMEGRVRELALSELRGCDLVSLKLPDVCHGDQVASRAIVLQHKTQRSVQFEITQPPT